MRFETSRYEWSHGHRPRGYGFWMFLVGSAQVSAHGTYSEAKRVAAARARELGEHLVVVLP